MPEADEPKPPQLTEYRSTGNEEYPRQSQNVLLACLCSLVGLGWFWYEVWNTTDTAAPIVADWGVASCVSCHAAGRDFILSDYPGN